MDETEKEAIRDEGLDPDDPLVVEALALVALELALLGSLYRRLL